MPEEGKFYQPLAGVERTHHHLPHWNQSDTWTFVTWRLADALPKEKLEQWRLEKTAWLNVHPEPWDHDTQVEYDQRFTMKIDDWLDQGSGSCLLRKTRFRSVVADALKYFEGERYHLANFVVMPNHVHVLFAPLDGFLLPGIPQSWKRHTSREINKLAGRTGRLWQDEYWDRLVRNERHFQRVDEYIRENPVKANLMDGEFELYHR